MPSKTIYKPRYEESHAVVIGIDKYKSVGPLAYACNDASAFADALTSRFKFPEKNVRLLIDQDATRESILRAFFDLSKLSPDDRVIVFYAGHGHTVSGYRGETGFLVPYAGSPGDLSTLIPWQELTRGSDLIPAKHILFLMDACYGGLALARNAIPPGSTRFMKDMLQRFSRQVLTAGKADEVVADGGGVRPGHSIFTAHLLNGLEGAAAKDGILTGQGLMSYVYDKVGSDTQSQQTPHYGFLDGDGDLIFDASSAALDLADSAPTAERDVFIEQPAIGGIAAKEETLADTVKRLIADDRERIRLDDFVKGQLRQAKQALSTSEFPTNVPFDDGKFLERLAKYETAIIDLQRTTLLLSHWASGTQIGCLEKIFARMGETPESQVGLSVWVDLQRYPIVALMYIAGISALASENYPALRMPILTLSQGDHLTGRQAIPMVYAAMSPLIHIDEIFKRIPGHERNYVPRSEYMFKKLQPLIEDELFVGRGYEALFDDFEILLALAYADLRDAQSHVWGPPGRFTWKEKSRVESDRPFSNFVARATRAGDDWGVLKAGFFGGSAARFQRLASGYSDLIKQLPFI